MLAFSNCKFLTRFLVITVSIFFDFLFYHELNSHNKQWKFLRLQRIPDSLKCWKGKSSLVGHVLLVLWLILNNIFFRTILLASKINWSSNILPFKTVIINHPADCHCAIANSNYIFDVWDAYCNLERKCIYWLHTRQKSYSW